ncbi:hypothetical protein [Bacillus alveayuensis]|jgi:hypothetical protein|nr:hypothetical protein [Bacillus alveayuensis]
MIGSLGIILGGICLLITLAGGAIVLPEGDLLKAVSFNLAIGTFIMTTAIILPFVPSIASIAFFFLMLIWLTLFFIFCGNVVKTRKIKWLNAWQTKEIDFKQTK